MSKLKEKIVSAGYSVKKEITIVVIVDVVLGLLTALGFIFTKNIVVLAIGVIAIGLFSYLYESKPSQILG